MPLPIPNKNEKENDFISRCMGSDVIQNDFDDQKQQLAVCYSQWDRKNETVIFKMNSFLESVVSGDVAAYEKPVQFKNGYIQKRNNKFVFLKDDKEVDSDEDIEVLKSRVGV